jgi:hypothetical protein
MASTTVDIVNHIVAFYSLFNSTTAHMLSRLRKKGPAPDPSSVNYTTEHVSLAKTLGRRRWLLDKLDERIPLIRQVPLPQSVYVHVS